MMPHHTSVRSVRSATHMVLIDVVDDDDDDDDDDDNDDASCSPLNKLKTPGTIRTMDMPNIAITCSMHHVPITIFRRILAKRRLIVKWEVAQKEVIPAAEKYTTQTKAIWTIYERCVKRFNVVDHNFWILKYHTIKYWYTWRYTVAYACNLLEYEL